MDIHFCQRSTIGVQDLFCNTATIVALATNHIVHYYIFNYGYGALFDPSLLFFALDGNELVVD